MPGHGSYCKYVRPVHFQNPHDDGLQEREHRSLHNTAPKNLLEATIQQLRVVSEPWERSEQTNSNCARHLRRRLLTAIV